MNDIDKTWPFWTDVLGQTYYPGDLVAVATVNGKSPQLVLARVERINRVNSSGEEITKHKYFPHDEPITKLRSDGSEYQERGEHRNMPSCTVRTKPLVDARGFGRWSTNKETGENRSVTYSIPENILKVKEEE